MIPLEITFRSFAPSEGVKEAIARRARSLDRILPRITSCRVAVEAESRGRRHGAIYRVRIDLRFPGGEIVVGRAPTQDHAHEDVYVAIRDAFDAARRRLQDHADRRTGSREQGSRAP